jgi:hypothetical protein
MTSTVVLAGILAITLPGIAAAQSRCSAYKIKAAARKTTCLSNQYAHAAQSNADPKQDNIDTCKAKFAALFAKLDLKGGCPTTGDAAAIETKVDAFVADLVTELDSGNPNLCQAYKITASAKKAKCLLIIKAKEAAYGVPVDPLKAQRCRDKFAAKFAGLELKYNCDTTGDAAAIEAKVDAYVEDVATEIPATTTTTTLP